MKVVNPARISVFQVAPSALELEVVLQTMAQGHGLTL